MTFYLKPLIIFIIMIVLHQSLIGQNDNYRRGVVIDSLAIVNSTETYALYLPHSFRKEMLSSIVFIFDPAARGRNGIQPFIASSEKYNHILICSNNSRNGPFERNFEIANRLFDTVFSQFDIDENQIYVAGFSGGSRLASAIAVLTGKIQGVIACGAGFSPVNSHVPISKELFSYVGLVGERDMNYFEMFDVRDWLDKFQIENELFTYDDDHRWPSQEQLLMAFGWLEIQAYKRNLRTRNDEILNDLFRDHLDMAQSHLRSNQYLKSVWEYERIHRNFSSIYNLDSIQVKLDHLMGTKKYVNEKARFDFTMEEESKIRKIFSVRFNNEINSEKILQKHKWWIKKLKEIDDEVNFNDDLITKNMFKRVQYSIYAMIVERSYSMLRMNQIEKALYCHELLAIMMPDRPMVYFNLAKDHAKLKNKEGFIENLDLAISKGFTDKDLILKTQEFFKYRESDEFKLLIESIE